MLARRHEAGKTMFPQKNYKTNPDNATHNTLTYKVVLIEM